jgi:hypothetical protein
LAAFLGAEEKGVQAASLGRSLLVSIADPAAALEQRFRKAARL